MSTGELWMGIATIIAVVIGPILAVWVTRINDDRRADKLRKFDVFRTLMRTRRMPIHPDHVGALNLVEVEFFKEPRVIQAWSAYMHNLSDIMPSLEEKDRFDLATKTRDSLLTKLIYEISLVVGIKLEQLDILKGNYVPQGWVDQEWEQQLARRHFINVFSGRSPLLVRPDQSTTKSPYPPPPEIKS